MIKFLTLLQLSFFSSFLLSQSVCVKVVDEKGDVISADVHIIESEQSKAFNKEEVCFENLSFGEYTLKASRNDLASSFKVVNVSKEEVYHIKLVLFDGLQLSYPSITILNDIEGLYQIQSSVVKVSAPSAGSFGDPSRVALRAPAVSISNDQTNGIVNRGIAPSTNKWTINDAEIVNPNHLANAGSFGDQVSNASGGVLMFPFEVVKSFEFDQQSKSINAISAVSNFEFNRKGDRFLKLGLLGMEGGYYQSFGKSQLNVHGRYSTVGLLTDLGADFGGEEIKFQDLFVNYNLNSRLNIVAAYGSSSNYRPMLDEEEKELALPNTDSRYDSEIQIVGLTYGPSALNKLRQSLFFSRKTDKNLLDDGTTTNFDLSKSLLSYRGDLSLNSTDLWLNANYSSVAAVLNDLPRNAFQIDNELNYYQFQFGFKRHLVNVIEEEKIVKLNLGADFTYDNLGSEFTLEPFLDFKWAKNNHSFNLSGVVNSQFGQDIVYLINSGNELKRDKVFNASLSYGNSLSEKVRTRFRAFYNYFFDLVEYANFSPAIVGVEYLRQDDYTNEGNAQSYGLEMIWDFEFKNGSGVNFNVSYFDLQQNDIDSRYNFGYVYNLVYSKQPKNKGLGVDLALHYRGGAFEYNPMINEFYLEQFSPYFRIDTRLKYVFKGGNELLLDIQNVTNTQNDAYYTFYEEDGASIVRLKKQLGLIPILSYKYYFD